MNRSNLITAKLRLHNSVVYIVNEVIETNSIFCKTGKINNFSLLEVFLRKKLLPLLFFVR